MGGERLPPMDVDYADEIKNYPAWVVESEDRVVGGLIMTFSDEQASIANIAVDQACQGQGIGRGLIEFAQGKARAQGYREVWLATHVLMHENLALYQRLGWVEVDRDSSRVMMKKSI